MDDDHADPWAPPAADPGPPPAADPWAGFRPVDIERCRNHPEEEVFRRGYCDLCDWARKVLEAQAVVTLGDKPPGPSSRRYFFLCPKEHGFTSRLSGADAICKRCKDSNEKNSVPSMGFEESWPRMTEVGPELGFQNQHLSHARALMVRVDPNELDLRKNHAGLKESFQNQSLQALIKVCDNILEDLENERPSTSGQINQLVSAQGSEVMSSWVEKWRFAIDLLLREASDRDVEVFGKTAEGSWSDAPNDCRLNSFLNNIASKHGRLGLRDVSVAVEAKGDRFLLAEEQKGLYRGLNVNKENHMVLLVTSVCACQKVEYLKNLPFHGIVELLKSGGLSHHDQKHCRGCDFLGRLCEASKTKTIVQTRLLRHNQSKLILKGLPYDQDATNYARAVDIMAQVEREVRRRDSSVALEWSRIEIRSSRRHYQSEAVVHFFQGELPYQIYEQAQEVMQRELQEAERTFRSEFQGQAPGMLYVADCYEEPPYSEHHVRSVVTQDGSECMGWFSQHQRADVPCVRLISAPHWLRRALRSLPEARWKVYRLTLPWEVLQFFDRCFYWDLREDWANHLHRSMKISQLDDLNQPADVFEQHGAGLWKLGVFPTRAPYQQKQFCDEFEDQWCTLLRHVYLFGKPTSARKGSAFTVAIRPDVEQASEPSEDSDDDEDTRPPSQPGAEPNAASNESFPGTATPSPAATAPPSPASASFQPKAPPPTPPTSHILCGRAIRDYRPEGDPSDGRYTQLTRGDWAIWKPELDEEPGWSFATVRGQQDRQGYVPSSYLQPMACGTPEMPLGFEAEIVSHGFEGDPMARGGTSDVYRVQLARGLVAAKVLHDQESKALVCAMHDTAQLFRAEVEAMKRLQHPNIAMMLDSGVTTAGRFLIVEEFVSGTTLAECLESIIDFRERMRVALQLADALNHIHALGIMHRDVKSANILVDVDSSGNFSAVKLSDFGLAKGVQERAVGGTRFSSRVCGTTGYMDPECVRGEGRSTMKSDVYSFGIVLLDLITGKVCGPENDHYKAVKRKRVTFHSSWPPQDSPLCRALEELARNCVQEFGEERPDVEHVRMTLQQLNRQI